MHAGTRMRAVVMIALLPGCGDMGLNTLVLDEGEAVLQVDPEGDIAFGGVAYSSGEGSEIMLLRSVGGAALVVLDVYLQEGTPQAFAVGDALPLPLILESGEDFPVEITFSPDAMGAYNGWVEVVVDSDTGEKFVTRRILGQGCDPETAAGTCE